MDSSPNTKTLVSLLWVFVGLNIVVADILSLYVPGTIDQVSSGFAEGVALSEELMLIGALFIQVPLLMIVLSHVLSPKPFRIMNTAAVIVTTAFVVGGGSLKLHYLAIASLEVLAMTAIVLLVWLKTED